MTEIEKTKAEIKMLEKKLSFLEELERTKTPVEEAFKKVFGVYPTNEITYNSMWGVFQKGYYAAQEDYKVGEYQEPEENEWKSVALRFGEELVSVGPYGYYGFTPDEWLKWALNAYEKLADDWLSLLKKEKVKKSKINDLAEKLLPDDHPYKIADEHGETNPYKQYLNSVEDEKKMEELGFVKSSDGNWTARPLDWVKPQTPEQEPEMLLMRQGKVDIVDYNHRTHYRIEYTDSFSGVYKWFVRKLGEIPFLEEIRDVNVYAPLEELYQKEVVKQKDDYPYKKYTPEETEQSLKEAFREARQTEKWKEIQKLIDEEDNDKNFKNSLDIIEEWGEKNKRPSLYDILMEWWTNEDWLDQSDESIIDNLVDLIDNQFIPPHHDTNDYQWNKCLKLMRDKLR